MAKWPWKVTKWKSNMSSSQKKLCFYRDTVHFHDCWTKSKIVHWRIWKNQSFCDDRCCISHYVFLIPGDRSDSLNILIWSTSWVANSKFICHCSCKHMFQQVHLKLSSQSGHLLHLFKWLQNSPKNETTHWNDPPDPLKLLEELYIRT